MLLVRVTDIPDLHYSVHRGVPTRHGSSVWQYFRFVKTWLATEGGSTAHHDVQTARSFYQPFNEQKGRDNRPTMFVPHLKLNRECLAFPEWHHHEEQKKEKTKFNHYRHTTILDMERVSPDACTNMEKLFGNSFRVVCMHKTFHNCKRAMTTYMAMDQGGIPQPVTARTQGASSSSQGPAPSDDSPVETPEDFVWTHVRENDHLSCKVGLTLKEVGYGAQDLHFTYYFD